MMQILILIYFNNILARAVKDHLVFLIGQAYWKVTHVKQRDHIIRQDMEWTRNQILLIEDDHYQEFPWNIKVLF